MKKVYISGAITGVDNYEELFKNAEDELKAKGYDVVNPVTIEQNHDNTWNSFMRVDLKAMLDCDAIYMLSNYKTSRGANIELNLAKELDFEVIYEDEKQTELTPDKTTLFLGLISIFSFLNIWMSIFYMHFFSVQFAKYSAFVSIGTLVVSYALYEIRIRRKLNK